MTVNGNQLQRPPKILVVDDEMAVHRLLSAYLQKNDFIVENCLHSQDIVSSVESFQPDLILLDLMMPELDGISATKRVRNMTLSSYLPIIMLTAKKEVRDLVTAMEAGADDYITKPFEFEELMARIKNMLRLKLLQDQLVTNSFELNEANQQISRLNHVLVQTNKQLQNKLYDFHNLFEVCYRVMSQMELHSLIKQALINILGIFATKSTMMMLVSKDDNNSFEIVDAKGFQNSNVWNFNLTRHDRLVHYLELIKKAFRISDISPEFDDLVPQLKEIDVEVVCPLFQDDDIIGILCLGPNYKDEEYKEDNLEALELLGNMLSVAVKNAGRYERIKALSYTDGMTGLHNYRFFRLRLKEEMSRTRRDESLISLLIIDVDHFKNYNDTLGHPAGDEVLRQVSLILQKSVRDNDIVARYGGEEFAVILPGADKEGALTLAERIREKVATYGFEQEEIQPEGNLTVSIGTATSPDDAVTEEDLIVRADKALYHAKNTGRNRVVDAQTILGNE